MIDDDTRRLLAAIGSILMTVSLIGLADLALSWWKRRRRR